MSLIRRLLQDTQHFLARVGNPHPEARRVLFRFQSPEDLGKWTLFSDAELGGKSTISLTPSQERPGTADLSGEFSREVEGEAEGGDGAAAGPDTPPAAQQLHRRLKRSGYAGMRVQAAGAGGEPLNLDDFDTLVFRVYGDGRKYIANVRCESWIVDEQSKDIWQAFLFARKGEWSEVEIPMSRFLLTWKGRVVESEVELNANRVTSLGISLAGGEDLQPEGPFRLGIDWVAAQNSSVALPPEGEERER